MKRKFTTSFKIQVVEKALIRNENTTLTEIANSLNIGGSTLSKWIVKAQNQEFETASHDEIASIEDPVVIEKRLSHLHKNNEKIVKSLQPESRAAAQMSLFE